MKKLSYILLTAAALFSAACGKELNPDDNGDAPERKARLEVTSDNGLFVPSEDNTSATVNFKNAGGELVIAVSTNLDGWTASLSDDSWLEMESDKHYVTLSAGRNESAEALASVLTITAYDANDVTVNYEVNLSQNYAGQPEITVSSNAVRFPAYGELSTVLNVETNSEEFDFACTSQWLLVEKTEGGLKLSVNPNDDNAQRTVDLTLTAGAGKDAAKDVIRISQDGKAYVVLSSSVAHSEKNGAVSEITVESNPELDVAVVKPESDDWYTATYADGKLAVTISAAPDSFQRKSEFTVKVGHDENIAEKTIRVIQIGEDTEEFIVEYCTLNDNELLALPVLSNTAVPSINVVVDWGDGSDPETVTGSYLGTNAAPFKSHRYAKAGKYILTVKGTAGQYQLSDNIYFTIETALYSAHLLNVISWGKLGVTTAKRMCYNSNQLETIPSDVCGAFENVTDFSESFYLCEKLKFIPEDLFKYAAKVTTFMRAFYNDGEIKEIPENLFANSPLATDFSYCFHCLGVGNMVVGTDKWMVAQGHRITVPEKLFANNPLATNFTQTFYGTNITTLPENLFANNPAVTSFNGLLAYCTELETVPVNLFANNPNVTNYGWLFYGSHVKELPAGLFKNASKATNINQMFLAADVEEFPEGFFEGLTGIKYITQLFQEANFKQPLKAGMFKGLDNATAAYQMFYRSNISELPSGLFEGFGAKSTGVAFDQTFFNCENLTSIPADLFDSAASNATTLKSCFAKCVNITSLPEGLGNNCVKVNNIQNMFDGCTGLKELPSSMFKGSAGALKNLNNVFAGCTSLKEVPDNLFSWITASNATFTSCFNTCTGLEKVGANVFPATTATTGLATAFAFCESLTDVSEDVFALCTKVNQMTNVFKACKSLKTVPEGLFAHLTGVTTFQETFNECSALSSVPAGLFAKNINVTKFTKTFYNCTALKTLPAGLFDTNTKVTDFTYLCYGCKALETLPDGLFDKNIAATTFSFAFEYCESLKAIPDGLFAKCTKGKTFEDTFAGCKAITSIPADLFAGVPAADQSVSFKECFTNCTSLTSIPASLFDAAKKAKNFNWTFAYCTKLTGESPFTVGDSGKVHLYERKTMAASDGYNASITGTNCFYECTGLDDYATIPSAWGGGGK